MTADGSQVTGRAIYERQRELNELCEATGLPLGTTHERVVDMVVINRERATVAQQLDGRLREFIMIWRYRALNPGLGSQHYQHGVRTAWEDAARALQVAIDGE